MVLTLLHPNNAEAISKQGMDPAQQQTICQIQMSELSSPKKAIIFYVKFSLTFSLFNLPAQSKGYLKTIVTNLRHSV